MKKMFINIISSFFRVVSLCVSYDRSCWLQKKRNALYTMWIKNYVGQFGEHSKIDFPCYLQGGARRSILIGDNTYIQSHCVLGCWKEYGDHKFTPSISIGNDCNIGEYNQISACVEVVIGSGLLTGRYVYIGDNSHGGLSIEESTIPPARRSLKSRGGIEIGENVWIGDKVTILDGVIIGNNVIIGANSVVTHDIPSNSMAAGVPAKVLKHL